MYLKKIHIQGFKSFADKTEIDFKDDITAIVGPNGSGKSNISDAIRWVLGEQSIKSLRGNKMEDIIFAGTNKRKSLSFSEVTIFFDNKTNIIPLEYSEIAVTRRMFRSGESEYYINKNSCRLKDVRNLFMDTGIGKDGYSIIGQGRIDEILSNKPEDRRNIFEEAAGIIKYRSKKEEAERKLKTTEENLIRINDLIYEISSNFEKLERESKKADEFINLFEELKSLETNIYISDLEKISGEKLTFEVNKVQIQNEIKTNNNQREEKQRGFEKLKIDINEKESIIESLRLKRDEIIREKEEFKNKLSLLNEKENFSGKDLKRVVEELEEIENKSLNLNDELNLSIKNLNSLSKENKDLSIKLSRKKESLTSLQNDIVSKEAELDVLRNDINFLYEGIVEIRGNIRSIKEYNANTNTKLKDLGKQKKLKQIKTDNIIKEIKALKSKEEDLKEYLEKKIKEKSLIESKRNNIQKRIDDKYKITRDLEIKIERSNSTYALYKNMENSYEGYYKSVKGLLKSIENKKVSNKGFHGVVADLFTVNEEYEMAINISLGSNIQNIVVDDEDVAKNMIKFLKDNSLGRVTFLPIKNVSGKILSLNKAWIEQYGILGLANEIISYKEPYEKIFKSLLGRTIVIDTINNAIKFARITNHIYRIVTLEGDLLNPGGSISGGSYKNPISIINRKNKIQSIKKEIDSLRNEFNNYNIEKTDLISNLNDIEERFKILADDIDTTNNKLLSAKHHIDSANKDKVFFDRDIEDVICEVQEITNVEKKYIDKLLEAKKSLKIDEEKLEKLKSDLKVRENAIDEIRHDKETTHTSYNDLNTSVKLLENKTLNFKNRVKNIQEQLNDNKLSTSVKRDEIENLKQNIGIIKKEKLSTNIKLVEKTEEEKEIEGKIKRSIKEKEEYMEILYLEQDNLKTLNETINTLESAKNDIEIKLSKLYFKEENIETKLYDEYKLSIEEASLYAKPVDNIKKSRNRIRALKSAIKKLGNVNLGALEEYKEVKERLEFMENQHTDLVESKENLRSIIKDMEKEMKINFLKSFEEIKNNFSKVFTELFNGGTATLELEDEDDDLLTSGVEIKVKPPGKVFQSLSLLSGGEKTLVAIALLFALLKTKPSPFCVLDEIDAALDDSNINRYTSYLEKIKKDTQFILITHRKTSMEIANVLYGVTMEEKGISKIISMKLKDDKDTLVS